MAMQIIEAHGGYRIVEGDITIERHGDKGVAERRLAALQEIAGPPTPEGQPSAAGPKTPAAPSAEETAAAELQAKLSGNVRECALLVEGLTDPVEVAKLRAAEEAGAARKTLLKLIDDHLGKLTTPAGEA